MLDPRIVLGEPLLQQGVPRSPTLFKVAESRAGLPWFFLLIVTWGVAVLLRLAMHTHQRGRQHLTVEKPAIKMFWDTINNWGFAKPAEDQAMDPSSQPSEDVASGDTGTVTGWDDEKGFGYIQPADGGKELLCHVSSVVHGSGSVRENDVVTYTKEFDNRSRKDEAKKVRLAPGTVASWETDRGFGFIRPAGDGDDLFWHASSLVDGEGSVWKGDRVTYKRVLNSVTGKDEAMEVRGVHESAPQQPSGGETEGGFQALMGELLKSFMGTSGQQDPTKGNEAEMNVEEAQQPDAVEAAVDEEEAKRRKKASELAAAAVEKQECGAADAKRQSKVARLVAAATRQYGAAGQRDSFQGLSQKYSAAPVFPTMMKEPSDIEWPNESAQWSPRERQLFAMSKGGFHPDQMAVHRRVALQKAGVRQAEVKGVPGRVSVCCPTIEARQMFHEQLWQVFDALDWQDKELVVLETFQDSASPFLTAKAKEDERIVFMPFHISNGEEWYIGSKRNMCTHVASGEIIVNFDDDDIYAPTYVNTMVGALRESNASAVTLSSWYIYDTRRKKIGFVDPEAMPWDQMGVNAAFNEYQKDSWIYGYGFSYVFYREVGIETPYLDMNSGEDYKFLCKLRDSKRHVQLVYDRTGIVLHTLHAKASSTCHVAQEVPRRKLLTLDVAKIAPLLNEYMAIWSAMSKST